MVEDTRQGREVVDASIAFLLRQDFGRTSSVGAGWGEGEKWGNSTTDLG